MQKELGQPEHGLATEVGTLPGAVTAEDNYGGGSDDIGDVSWTVPTVTIRYPSNIPGLPGHHWSERDRERHADRAQGRDRRRQGRWR